jgi:isoleucyl-tRNA synthetase
MFKEVSTSKLNFPEMEERVLDFWRQNDIFQKSMEERKNDPPFVFLEGPPFANAMPGVHHVLARILKDCVCRYKTMTGHYVHRKAGWDTHGLPIEFQVEKQLGIKNKREIEEYGIPNFIEKCKENVFTYEQEFRRLTERIAFWVDLDNPYITLNNKYIESVWWIYKRFWEKGMLYEGLKVQPYCPRCGTVLSSHEVAQGYEEVQDPSVFVKLAVKGQENTFFLMWTTTPWTLPSNVALAVGGDYEYAQVEYNGDKLILAKELLGAVFGYEEGKEARRQEGKRARVEEVFRGRDLLGREYEPLFRFVKPDKKAYYVIEGDFVTLDEGTGIVHIAPAFGQDDYEMSQKYDLPVVQLVDTEGNFTPEVKPWAGQFVKDADPKIIENLKERGLLLKSGLYSHNYPFCWRCDTPLLYYARSSWFIKTTAFKDKMLEKNQEINWYPEYIKNGRFGDWLENNVDWALSRERYWGTPLPIWKCSCGYVHCVGSIEELKEMGKRARGQEGKRARRQDGKTARGQEGKDARGVPDSIELHRPYIDEVVLECPKCNAEMHRVPVVGDCWFDSGSAHTAQWHYPFENQELFKKNFPVDFIAEGIDQTRGWFYSLLVTGAFLYDQPTYKHCLCHELVLGPDGMKMSKSRGNTVDPWSVINKQGTDSLRWYFYTVSPPWTPCVFSEEAVSETLKQFMGTLYNVYGFFVLYANVDGIKPDEYNPPILLINTTPLPPFIKGEGGQGVVFQRPLMDRWILSRFHSLTKKVRDEMEQYNITTATRAIGEFVDELSNWYVRRSRDRFWGTKVGVDKPVACNTLYQVLVGTAKLLAPFTPFITEEIYQNLVRTIDPNAPESVHLCDYPEADEHLINEELESDMERVRNLVVMGRAARNRAKVKIRQPLSAITVSVHNDAERESISRLMDLIREELNVKEVRFAEDVGQFATFQLKPNFKLLGPKYGKLMPDLAKAVAEIDPSAAKRELDLYDELKVEVSDKIFHLTKNEVEVALENKPGYAVEAEGSYFVALSTELTDELVSEGFARELVNKLQLMRKEADFHVSDRIKISVQSTEIVQNALATHRDYIMGETLALEILKEPGPGAFVKEWDVNDQDAVISVERV